MKAFLTLLLLFYFAICIGQSKWFPVGAQWYYSKPGIDYTSDKINGLDCIIYQSIGDTIIQNKVCRIVEIKYSKNQTKIGNIFLHQKEQVVSYFNGDSFSVLYDFSAKAGDTISVHNHAFHPIAAYFSANNSIDQFSYKIEEVDSVKLNGNWLKRQKVIPIKNSTWAFSNTSSYIVESIGSLNYFFGQSTNIHPELSNGLLRYYKDSLIEFKNNQWKHSPNMVTFNKVIDPYKQWYVAHSQLAGKYVDTISTQSTTNDWWGLWYHGILNRNKKVSIGKVTTSVTNDSIWFTSDNEDEKQLIFNLNLKTGDTFDFGSKFGGKLTVDTILFRDNLKLVVFESNEYWGDSIQFIEGVGPNIGLAYKWDSGMVNPYVICQFNATQKVYTTSNGLFRDCSFVNTSINTQSNNVITVSPVPFQNQLTIHLPQTTKGYYNIMGMDGKTSIENEFQGQHVTVDTSCLKAGIYILKVYMGHEYSTIKIVKR
ncbi:T9SS type A sorting domain-containing protein [Prolixibacteraceae bacterium JC049]|nr:T9SS type A sorting domain-containing protein [Prolixibacteraceae bacterium JC049]